ncbi:hypothetical protein RJJ37_14055 [Rhizobium redzepovicii]|uniref:Uncharacterized protein n=1 Tax=Rhizobium redzepovicii TaxID=2867518 RepID=A0AAW8P181_9HYPH|nr:MULTISPECIES: hypothetical protein [Rhizobium]MDR9760747.1 hypothetical protein [Rhizobium redzepovicii]
MISVMMCGKSDEAPAPDSGHKKRPRQEPAYRAWVLSPDGYTILPMRPITNARTIAIFIAPQLKPNRAAVNACGGDEWRLSATVAFAI